MIVLKDERLAHLSKRYNVAQFASFAPDGSSRFQVMKFPNRTSRTGPRDIIEDLFARVGSVNVRTFLDDQSKSTDFVYGITNPKDAISLVARFSGQGLYTIVNETVDVHDGGVSGVVVGGVAEFAPDATPRIVEESDSVVARVPFEVAMTMLQAVYGRRPALPMNPALRVEFSVHPSRVGHRGEHSLVWEATEIHPTKLRIRPTWPNRFSEMIGDKVFGLLLADANGLPVPRTTVVSRRIAPFKFGSPTGTAETWLRTSPRTAIAGKFTTQRGWTDPFELLRREDKNNEIASVLAQEGVDAKFAGGAASQPFEAPLIEGTAGYGDGFMLGGTTQLLPERIRRGVRRLVRSGERIAGSVQIEWVHDGRRAWLVQIHGRTIPALSTGLINPGEPDHWITFDPTSGLERLRETVAIAVKEGAGIEITREVGVTSHFGDVIRKAGVPGRLAATH